MTRLRLLLFQTKKTDWLESATQSYLTKILPLAKFDIEHLKTPKAARDSANEKKREEATVILKALGYDLGGRAASSGEPFYLFDEKGKSYDSLKFSSFISQQLESGVRRCNFVIGGPYGFADEVKSQARGLITLSPLTFSHHVAQVVVLEQFYRALAIRNKLPYHNE